MSQWTALFLIVVVLALDKQIMAWLSLQRTRSAEKTAEHEREWAEAEERRAGLDKQRSSRSPHSWKSRRRSALRP